MRVITLRPDARVREFERVMNDEVFPAVQVLRRNVQRTQHHLFKSDDKVSGHRLYVWTTIDELVGGDSDPLTPDLPDEVAKKIEQYGTVATFSRLNPGEDAALAP